MGKETAVERPVDTAYRSSACEHCEDGEDAAVVVLGVGQVELLEDSLHVSFDGPRAEVELLRDRAVRPPFRDQR